MVVTGQTIQQIKAEPTQTFFEYAGAMLTSVEASVFWVLLGFSVLGMIAHYIRLWASKQVEGDVLDYLRNNPRGAVYAIIGAAGWSFGEVSAGLYQFANGEVFSWGLVVLSGFKNGYGADSLANKGTPPARDQWTPFERMEHNSVMPPKLGPQPKEQP